MKRWLIGGWGLICVAAIVLLAWVFCPRPELAHFKPYSKAYFDRPVYGQGRSQGWKQGKPQLLRLTLAADERYRLHENLRQISPKLIAATLLYEDQHFYDHAGVDFPALLRAFWATYISGDRRIGASTITMQVARLRWNIASHTPLGKLQQILRALQLSRHYSKAEILEAYLNLAPYGGNIEGVAAASLIYFNKKPAELSLVEALTLAVIPQNPSQRNPAKPAGYNELLTARALLLLRWLETHPDDEDQAKYFDLALSIRAPNQLPFAAPHFINYLQQQLPAWSSGYINTSLNSGLQHTLESIVQDYVGAHRHQGISNAAALLVNYQTHGISAMVGSADFFNPDIEGQVNGTTAKRSPGSTLKPLVYALAMEEGLIHPLTLLKDSPRKFGGFTPENYDKRFLGPVSAKDALIASRNVPAVDLQAQLTNTSFYQLLQRAGVSELKAESFYGLALALGGGEVTALELASLYAMLANAGQYQALSGLPEAQPEPAKTLLSAEASYLVLDILKDNPPPGALSLQAKDAMGNDVPWKTGTSWAFRDAWSVGISGPYVLVVWVGNFNGEGNAAFIGRNAAAPLFFRIMNAVVPPAHWRLAEAWPLESMNLKRLDVCAGTGDLYQQHCPAKVESWFIPGVSPIKLSNIYRAVPINKQTGRRACWQQPGVTENKVFAFWPSDFLEIYRKAGISLVTPPPFEKNCTLNQTSSSGKTPEITSPQTTVDYVSRLNSRDRQAIPLEVIADSDVKRLHWFIDNRYIGSVANGESLLWAAAPGNYEVRVVDDAARSASKRFRVVNTSL